MAGNRLDSFRLFKYSNENDLERIILKNDLLKQFKVFEAKETLNEFRNFKRYADVLLIEKDYNFWSIGEVEISKHSMPGHIFPQLLEFHVMVQSNMDVIRQNYVKIAANLGDRKAVELISYNQPILTLIIDEMPSSYLNIEKIITTFCNVIRISRYRNEDEEYRYLIEENFIDLIEKATTPCYVSTSNFLSIDHPNLVGMHKNKIDSLIFDDKVIGLHRNHIKVDGELKLVHYLDEEVRSGKYYLTRHEEKLILNKKL